MIPDTNSARGAQAPPERRDRPVMIPSTRKSCDSCHAQKRKCDGDGKGKCGRCSKHRQECIYSSRTRRATRTRPRPKAPSPAKKLHRPRKARDVGTAAGTPIPGGCSIERSRLRASPATGLVGMEEHALLKSYFGCLGFLPLTSHSVIREAIITLLCPIAITATPRKRNGNAQRLKSSGSCPRDRGESKTETPPYFGNEIDVPVDAAAAAGVKDGLRTDISVCTFWCAVATGGMVEGRPAKLVERYFRMAEEGLESCTDWNHPTLATAQAWAMLANTFSFVGDIIRFQLYMQRARSLLQVVLWRSSDIELPMGLLENLMCERSDAASEGTRGGSISGPETTEGGKPRSQAMSIHAATSEGHMFAFHVKSINVLQQTMYRRSQWRSRNECLGESETSCSLCPEEIVNDIRECVAPFEALEQAVDKPHIREGTGALMINSMIQMAKALKGDVPAARKRLARVVDVLERYPGLSINLMGQHIAHSAAAWLAATDDPVARGWYGRLRKAYNSVNCAGIRHPLPPYECWLGVDAFCDDVVCREVATLVEEWPVSLPSPSPPLPHADAAHRAHSGAQAPLTACLLGESDIVRASFPSLSQPKAHGFFERTAIPRPGSTRQEEKAEDTLLLDGRQKMELEETTETLPSPLPGQDPVTTWILEGFSTDIDVPYEPPGSALPETSNPTAYAVTVQRFGDLEDPRPRGDSGGGRVAEGENLLDLSYLVLDDSDLEMTSAAATVDDDLGAPNFIEITYKMLSK